VFSPRRIKNIMMKAARSVVTLLFCLISGMAPINAGEDPLAGAVSTANSAWCGTQTRFEQKMHARGYDPASTAYACPDYGPCDNPSTRDLWVPVSGSSFIRIKLAIHILANSDGSQPFSTPEGVQDAVNQVNQLYLSSRIQFDYVFDQVNSSEWRVLSEDEIDPMKIATAFDPTVWLNVWATNVLFGYSLATFPFDPDALEATGGVVMGHFHWGGNFSAFAHELGHCLGLWHNFHGVSEVEACGHCYESVGASNRDRVGDYCSDTPPTPLIYDCGDAAGIDPCSGLSWDYTQPENCMGYTPPSCRNMFTPQQHGRMRCWIDDVLFGWVAPAQDSCCQGRVGDANNDGQDEPSLGDIMAIVDMLFISGRPVVCLEEADVNQSGGAEPVEDDITLGDVAVLIDYLFISGSTVGLLNCL
jgi:hypothetical protein